MDCVEFVTHDRSINKNSHGYFGYSVLDDMGNTVHTVEQKEYEYNQESRFCHSSLDSIKIETTNDDGWIGTFRLYNNSTDKTIK